MDNYKEEIKKCINDLKDKKTFYKQIPNLITLSRIIGVIPMNILYLTGNIIGAIITAFIIFLSDMVDGKIARKYNITSSFGADLDAVSDKILALGLCIPLAIKNPLLLLPMSLEIAISTINTISKVKGYNPKSNYIGKAKTWLLSITLILGYIKTIINIPTLIFNILLLLTSAMQTYALSKYIKTYKEKDKEFKNKEENKEINIDNEIKKDDLSLEKNKELTNQIEYLKHEKELLLGTKKRANIKESTKVKTRTKKNNN